MEQQKTRVERISSQIKSNPIVATLIILGTIVIALATFTDAATKLFSLISRQSPAAARAELARMSLGYTPKAFVLSATTGDLMAVKLFLTAGMDPNATDEQGLTALGTASYKGHVQIVTVLVKAGADGRGSLEHPSALVEAASAGHIDSLRVLLEKSPDAETINSAFIEAAITRHHEVVRLLADRGAEVKRVGSIAMMAIWDRGWGDQAVSDTTKILLDLGADPNGKDQEGWTALLAAAQRDHPTTVRLLLNRGADANARCSGTSALPSFTPRSLANQSSGRWGGGVAACTDRCACPHVLGRTALMFAAESGSTSIVRALLGSGARVNDKDADGKTPLDFARRGLFDHADRATEVIQLLKSPGTKDRN